MFDEAKEPVDIFAEVDKPAARQPLTPGQVPTTRSYAPAARGPSKLLMALIGLVVLLGVGGGGAYFLLKGSAPAEQPAAVEPDTDTETEQPAPPVDNPPTEQPAPTPPPEPVEPPAAVPPPQPEAPVTPPETATAPPDADSDGLTDDEELALGTDPQAVDTDSDGLTDRDEVNIYKTDPLNPDSDGDGFLDGKEVQGGYNPNGPGKLFDVPPKP